MLIILVDKDVAEQLRSMVREGFVKRYEMTGGSPELISGRENLIKNYTKTLTGQQRIPAAWTLEQVLYDETARLESIILKHALSWTCEKPFDTSILMYTRDF
ncbi:MAG: hypothetical protein HFG49_07790 [Lachnospiraceae bacterium]|nr:hypothetical protein [Lachnospiraceae bacterium]